MLILSRLHGESVVVNGPEGACLVTLLHIRGSVAVLLISHAPPAGRFDAWTAHLQRDQTVSIGDAARVSLVDLREDKARLGIEASRGAAVHRLEVWEAINRPNRAGGDDDDTSGSTAPRV